MPISSTNLLRTTAVAFWSFHRNNISTEKDLLNHRQSLISPFCTNQTYPKMGVVILDGSTVRSFVGDEAVFNKSMDDRFAVLDLNGDGVLSRSELRRAFETFRLTENDFGVDTVTPPDQMAALYDSIFDQFDLDRSGTVDLAEFRSEMKKIFLAIADGLGASPVQIAFDAEENGMNNLLQEAADLEAEKIAGGKRG